LEPGVLGLGACGSCYRVLPSGRRGVAELAISKAFAKALATATLGLNFAGARGRGQIARPCSAPECLLAFCFLF